MWVLREEALQKHLNLALDAFQPSVAKILGITKATRLAAWYSRTGVNLAGLAGCKWINSLDSRVTNGGAYSAEAVLRPA